VWLTGAEKAVFFEDFRFDGTCRTPEDCFSKAVTTLLLVSSIAYSLGAVLGLKRRSFAGSENLTLAKEG
jgi:hypothetical protein